MDLRVLVNGQLCQLTFLRRLDPAWINYQESEMKSDASIAAVSTLSKLEFGALVIAAGIKANPKYEESGTAEIAQQSVKLSKKVLDLCAIVEEQDK